ncbi:UDP-N-acetylmuramoyl-L-alanyl-D-glutamate--2,6-diaminopimelate ligase, partial [bacterium]|nr:UDP-N-acetylmuramoyl-L-alanyl-D-glutamate--2,6-diaminopimelate ligase [bacterium]
MNVEEIKNCISITEISEKAKENFSKDIRGISEDSRQIGIHFIFVAYRGFSFDGNSYIMTAIDSGAVLIVTDDKDVYNKCCMDYPIVFSRDIHESSIELTDIFYSRPSSRIKIIGITGTNGKTTITYLLKHIFKHSGFSTGVIGTNGIWIKDKFYPNQLTTPRIIQLQSILASMVDEGVEYCFMEVSSHSLDLGRVDIIEFDGAVFTNLTQDHLDFHGNFENYYAAKKKLFELNDPDKPKIINSDDKYGLRLCKEHPEFCIRYSIKDETADYYASEININMQNTCFKLTALSSSETFEVKSEILGRFNVYNILASIAITRSIFPVPLQEIINIISEFKAVCGRFEKVYDENRDALVIIDYAHTPDSLENILETARDICCGQLVTIFGCGGDRDKTKRPLMGEIAQKLSDQIIITSDNP